MLLNKVIPNNKMKKLKKSLSILTLSLTFTFVNAQSNCSTKKFKNMEAKAKSVYVETGKMKLKEGVTDEQFIEIERNIRKGIINKQPGFISREFGIDTDSFWHFRIYWTSKEAGDA